MTFEIYYNYQNYEFQGQLVSFTDNEKKKLVCKILSSAREGVKCVWMSLRIFYWGSNTIDIYWYFSWSNFVKWAKVSNLSSFLKIVCLFANSWCNFSRDILFIDPVNNKPALYWRVSSLLEKGFNFWRRLF